MRKDVLTDKKTSKIIKQPHLSRFRQSTEEMVKKNNCDHCTDKNSWKNIIMLWRIRRKKISRQASVTRCFVGFFK